MRIKLSIISKEKKTWYPASSNRFWGLLAAHKGKEYYMRITYKKDIINEYASESLRDFKRVVKMFFEDDLVRMLS